MRKVDDDVRACVYCVSGIYVFFILFGIAQERINTREYGAERERMPYTIALICAQCSTNVLLAAVALKLSPPHKRSYMDHQAVAKMASSYIGAMFCSNLALQYINYPTQVLIKSCKMVPVMIANILMSRRDYSNGAKARVLLLTGGICAFLLAKPAVHEHAQHDVDAASQRANSERLQLIGLALALTSLACDGYTGGAQDRIVHAVRPTSHQLMLWINAWAVALLSVAALATGQGIAAVLFAIRHPEMAIDLAMFCASSALGQNFIYFSIARFGALPTAVITTTRKFFTILASVLWFRHPVGAAQWLAIGLVFGALASELHDKLSGTWDGRADGMAVRATGERRGSDATSEMGQLTDGGSYDSTLGMLSLSAVAASELGEEGTAEEEKDADESSPLLKDQAPQGERSALRMV